MKTRMFFIILLWWMMACSSDNNNNNTTIANNSHPNILLVIADDMGVDASVNYSTGATKPQMPTLQRLADEGITFDNAWVFPECSPTRASIITGKYGVKTSVLNATDSSMIKTDEQTLQAYLDQQLGKIYAQAIIGKWHLSKNEPNRPNEMGIDYYAGLLSGAAKSYDNWTLTENGQETQRTDYITTKLTDLAMAWIEKQTKPWFCWLAYTAPHTPFHLPPTALHSQGILPTDQASIDANSLPYYMAMIESIDSEMNRLLTNLSKEELENTIVVFIGDNGTPGQVIQSPYVKNRSKSSIYQGGIHVPLIVSGKGVTRKNERDENLINSTDLFATIANIAGVSATKINNSYSFKNLLTTSGTNDRNYNYSEILNNEKPQKSGYTIRNKQYKLLIFDNNTEQFYDLENDAFEAQNLLNNTLSDEQQNAYNKLKAEAIVIRK